MSTIQVHFILTGSFDPSEVTIALNLQPTRTWRVGERIQNTSATYKHDGWQLSSHEIKSLDVSQQVVKMLDILAPYDALLQNILHNRKLDAEFACVINIEEDQFPTIHFDLELIQRIWELNAQIDIDLY